MSTTLIKVCALGMTGAMAVGLVACGGKSSSSDTPATTATQSSALATASATPTESTRTTNLKRLSKDDFTKAVSGTKINNQTFTVVDSSQLGAQVEQVVQAMNQAKFSPEQCGQIIKQTTASVTGNEINNIVSAASTDQPSPSAINFNIAMSDRQKKTYENESEQFSKCGHATMTLQGHKTTMTMKVTPIKGYEDIAKQASLYTTISSADNGPEMSSSQAYVWLKNDQMVQASAQDAATAQSTLKAAVDALGIDAK
ncbi:hypothetical protein FYJ43_05300 [Cutibacterium sp. WCA-380-WT-3A]|uniref:Lipoprotein n=1 Tax=Cutibacterium porci TaxID=2605781 RepID=A0A7K0J6A5_9ACTN|nr:hypothetical protein [Cutibacterium porci]MSS45464.1 hypothetical protein [Cutibacterium porci]